MDELLKVLGYRKNVAHRLCFLSVFITTVLAWNGLSQTLVALVGGGAVTLQAAGWVAWFSWQGWWFAWRRQRYLASDAAGAYRRAFYADILPGTSFGLSQMLAPLANGVFFAQELSASWQIVAALAILAGGVTLLILGFKSIGIAGASFLYEYQPVTPGLVQESIYSCIRHPLFLGGVIASVGLSLCFTNPTPLALAAINLAALPIYCQLEDRRLVAVLGEEYAAYRAKVGGLIPKPERWQRQAAHLRPAYCQVCLRRGVAAVQRRLRF